MDSCAHVCFGVKPVRWSSFDNLNTLVGFDDYHEEVILIRGEKASDSNKTPTITQILISDKLTLEWKEYSLKSIGKLAWSPFLSAKLSPDKTCLALRVSEKDVKVVDSGGIVITRSCRGGNSVMLAIHWLKNDLLLFVTNNGVELYALKGDKLKHIKTAAYQIKFHWFMVNSNRQSEEDVLLLVDEKNIFQAYQITSKNITKICKFYLDCSGTSFEQTKSNDKFFQHQLALCILYGKIVCVFVNEKKGHVHLLRISTDSMEIMQKYELMLPGKYAISVIDNVVVLHNIKEQVSMMFDVRGEKNALCAPLPIGLPDNEKIPSDYWSFWGAKYVIDAKNDYAGTKSTDGPKDTKPDTTKSTDQQTKSTDGKAADQQAKLTEAARAKSDATKDGAKPTDTAATRPSDQRTEAPGGTMYKVELNFEAIVHSWAGSSRTKLIDFLLKRSLLSCKLLVLQIIRDHVLAPSPGSLSILSKLFTTINRICYDAKQHADSTAPPVNSSSFSLSGSRQEEEPIRHRWSEAREEGVERNNNGYIIINQTDMYYHVFEPARDAAHKGKLSGSHLIAPVTEYLRSVCRHYLRPESLLNDLLVALLIEEKRYYEFHQYLQYHILNDSVPIAETLLELSSTYPAAYQLGLDMLFRLKEFGKLLRVMLGAKQVIAALRLVSHKSPLFEEKGLAPRDFLRVAMEDTQVFYSTFEYFRARNVTLRNSPAFLRDDAVDEFENHFQKLFAENQQRNSTFWTMVQGEGGDDGAASDEDSGPAIVGAEPVKKTQGIAVD